MPDPERKTVSASQVAALFESSRWATRWMLYQHLANGMPLDTDEDNRVAWGRRLEGVILEAAADELGLRVDGHHSQEYVRHAVHPLGATPDGWAFDPGRGVGVVEAKNVDGLIYRQMWGDHMAPRDVELQVQAQMLVGGHSWGVISALVGGNELVLLEREPNEQVQAQIIDEAERLMRQVRGEEAPPAVFGDPMEIPGLDWLYPHADPEKEVELDADTGDLFRRYAYAREQRLAYKRAEDQMKAQVLAAAGDAGRVVAPGLAARVKKSQVAAKTAPPDVSEEALAIVQEYDNEVMTESDLPGALGQRIEILRQALNQEPQTVRKASVRTTVEIEDMTESSEEGTE